MFPKIRWCKVFRGDSPSPHSLLAPEISDSQPPRLGVVPIFGTPMDILVLRGKSADEGTPSKLTTLDGFVCDSQELPWRNNRTGVSCILADTYNAELWLSPHLGWVVRLEDKHGRKSCLIHSGNFAGDTDKGKVTQVHGCTEVGRGFGEIALPKGGEQHGVLNSKKTLADLIAHIGQGPHRVTYRWDEGCEPDDLTDAQAA